MASRTQVLIVGAGPVGLAAAIELGHRGIACVVVERNDRIGHAPRAKTTNARTREHLRRWGIADDLKRASPLGIDYPSDVHFITRLGGFPLARFENAFDCAPVRNDLYSEHAQWIPQYKVEEVLRAHAQSLPGVTMRFGVEIASFTQDESGVAATLREVATGQETTIACDYLIGADGSRSTVRRTLGIGMDGARGLSRNYNIVFRAPGMAAAHRHGPGIMYWQVNATLPSMIGPMDRDDIWFFMPTGVPEGVTLKDSEAAALIRDASGIDLPYEILSSDEWTASRLIAQRYRDRRVFLAGDACHLHPPFGGYGMNMGIADGVDLGWKLAAVLKGWGGAALLDAYEAERRPVHAQVMDEAVANHSVLTNQLVQPGIEDATPKGERIRADVGARVRETKVREFKTLGMVLGYRYEGSPIIVSDGTAAPPINSLVYAPSAVPGSLAPHAWLDDGVAAGASLYDRFGKDYTLLVMGAGIADETTRVDAEKAAQSGGVPLTVVECALPRLRDVYERNYALIRPDQHVAWRGDEAPDARVFAKVAGRT